MKKINILNLLINNINKREVLSKIVKLAKERTPSYVCFVNAHMTVEANNDVYMRNVVNSATFALADGYPVAKAFKYIHDIKQERIAGMDFFPELLKSCEIHNLNVCLLGSTESVLNAIEAKAKIEFPKLKITNKISPPFNQEWPNYEYIEAINKSNTNVVFVALGCPLQEKWMYENHKDIKAVLLGVGGAFPVYSGELSRAPKWMSKNGFEWLYRLIKEPKRMWKRYFYTNTVFLRLLVLGMLKNGR